MTSMIHFVVLALDAISIGILIIGVAKGTLSFIKNELTLKNLKESAIRNNLIKNYLGSYVLLSLEVLIAADIIESIMNPTLEDILILAAVVIIRTVISYFLHKEINSMQEPEG